MLALLLGLAVSTALGSSDAGAAPPFELGTELRRDGYWVRPPQGFRMARLELFQGSRVGVIGSRRGTPGRLSAALQDGEGEDAATMLISLVEAPFQAVPTARDEFPAAAIRHFSEELDLKLAVEKAELVAEPVDRLELVGTVRQQDQLRRVLIAAVRGESRHAVILFSAPAGRWNDLSPALTRSLDSFRIDGPSASEPPRALAAAVVGAAGLALVLSLSVWRRRRRRLSSDSPRA